MKRRGTFNPKHYQHKDFTKIIKLKGKSKVDILFEKIKTVETINQQKNPNDIKDGLDLDNRIKEIQNISKIPQNKKQYIIINNIGKENQIVTTKIILDKIVNYEDPASYIENDNVLSSTQKYDKILKDYLQMLEKIGDEYSYCNNKVAESDREIQDFLHELRMPKKSASEGYKLYQLGHRLEMKRQGYKNHLAYLQYILDHMSYVKNKIDLNILRKTINYINNEVDSQQNKIYMPRSDLNLSVGDKFRALPTEEQEIIRKNYEKGKQKRKS